MKALLVATLVTFLTGCVSWDVLMGDNTEFAVKIAATQAIYGDGSLSDAEVCDRAFRAIEISDDIRRLGNSDVLSMAGLDKELSRITKPLNPVTAAVLLDIAGNIAQEYTSQITEGMLKPDAKIAIGKLLSIIDDVALTAHESC